MNYVATFGRDVSCIEKEVVSIGVLGDHPKHGWVIILMARWRVNSPKRWQRVNGNNNYFNRNNNPQDWPDGWTTQLPLSNDILYPIIFQLHHIHLCITFIHALHLFVHHIHPCDPSKFIINTLFYSSQNCSSSNLKHHSFTLKIVTIFKYHCIDKI